ncbi:hypothetical protein EW146_g5387 [Bondarzewia mesenterica]|uniref:Uncharacterized protein n=1 Tax=Bondarzewia mesenterica TaxID=1095465 RepID=A0A4V3XEU8_9AGAM|nr:hypothetical protein EW146_g5387 [Bondarzewia mesenterica]
MFVDTSFHRRALGCPLDGVLVRLTRLRCGIQSASCGDQHIMGSLSRRLIAGPRKRELNRIATIHYDVERGGLTGVGVARFTSGALPTRICNDSSGSGGEKPVPSWTVIDMGGSWVGAMTGRLRMMKTAMAASAAGESLPFKKDEKPPETSKQSPQHTWPTCHGRSSNSSHIFDLKAIGTTQLEPAEVDVCKGGQTTVAEIKAQSSTHDSTSDSTTDAFDEAMLDRHTDAELILFVKNAPPLVTTRVEPTKALSHGLLAKFVSGGKCHDEISALEYARTLGVRVPAVRRVVLRDAEWCSYIIIMERIHGRTLEELWPKIECCRSARFKPRPDLVFEPLHEYVFIHQDLAPRNMIVDARNRLWIVDWGYAGFYPAYVEDTAIETSAMPWIYASSWRARWLGLSRWIATDPAGPHKEPFRSLAEVHHRSCIYVIDRSPYSEGP